ncbi:EF-hand domain-containing protein [Verminephrobacter eiseniae]|uniref:EF-hand domain-containing protein n=1 Tax=Verminephrobacter eiseniae TaxID=364317 RepID=UPI002236F5B4|nr:EF-hand domain-containing protein [Verminephrobacter eiseniae]MCW5236380.1 EF-hand domain-containing protein [Verminephrobacter eiseniae]
MGLAGLVLSAPWFCSAAPAQTIQTAPPHQTLQATQAPPEGASPGSPAALTRGEIKAMREFKMLDFNGDGKLSRAEVRLFPRLAAAFDEADTDHDGYVSYAEVRAFAARYRARHERERAAAGPAALPKAPP